MTASLNFFFYSCCCFFNGAATALKMCVCVWGGGAVTACLSCFFKVAATAFFVKTH